MSLVIAPWALLTVSAMWGISFVWMKDILDQQDVYSFLFTRFLLASIAMIILRPTVLRSLSKNILKKGTVTGFVLGAGYIFQTLGLDNTTPAITGFVTGLYVVFVPLLSAAILRERVSLQTWIYVALATIGLGFLSLKEWSVGLGESYVLVSAILFAIHILLLGHWSKGFDSYAFALIQLIGCAIITGVSATFHGFTPPPDRQVWGVALFTAIFATAFAFVIQTWSQARISATKVAVILTMEVVFAAFFSVGMGREELTLRLIIGGALVLAAMLLIIRPKVSES